MELGRRALGNSGAFEHLIFTALYEIIVQCSFKAGATISLFASIIEVGKDRNREGPF